jgi:hypothetical protein
MPRAWPSFSGRWRKPYFIHRVPYLIIRSNHAIQIMTPRTHKALRCCALVKKPGPPGLEVLKGRNSLPHSAENAAHWKNGETSHRAPYKTHSLSPSGFCMLWFSQGLKRIWGDAAARRNEGCHCRNVDSYWRLAFSCGFAAANGPLRLSFLTKRLLNTSTTMASGKIQRAPRAPQAIDS